MTVSSCPSSTLEVVWHWTYWQGPSRDLMEYVNLPRMLLSPRFSLVPGRIFLAKFYLGDIGADALVCSKG